MSRRKRRRQLLVDRGIQLGLSARIVGILAAYMLLFGCVAAIGPLFTVATGQPGDAAVVVASERLDGLVSSYLLPALLTFTCLGMHCFVLLHRIAGPAYRFRMVLSDMRRGEIAGRVKLRQGDFLVDVAESLDATVASLRDDFTELKREATELADRLEDLPGGTDGNGGAAVGEARTRSRRLVELLDKYRTSMEAAEGAGDDGGVAPEPGRESREELESLA